LDEADEMLNQGFYEEVTRILDCLPKDRQVLLFSATVPPDIQSLIGRYTREPETLLLSGDVLTVDHIQHVRYDLNDAYPKPRNLIYLLEMEEPENAIIFCNTRDDTALVTAVLNRNGFDAELLNGDLPQKERERVMAKIKRGEVTFMVATDIAARGIDISDLGHVINYSLPEDPAVYLHRVGRTGRIGKKGVAINLVSGREISTLSVLEKKYNIAFEKRQMPSPEEALKLWTERHVREIKEASSGSIYEGYLGLAGQLKVRPDADDLIAFMLRYFLTHQRMEKAQAGGAEPRHEEPREHRPRESREGRDGGRRGERPRRERGDRPDRFDRPDRAAPRRSGPSDAELFRQSGGDAAATPVSGERAERPARRERPERDRGERRPRRSAPEAQEGQARLWIGIGQDVAGDEAGLKAALDGVGAPSAKILVADVRPTFSYAIVAEADVSAFEAANGKLHGERPLKIERARR
jgi:ATP-dependent RNA helicase DeaD